jgi:hypothetical protein
MSTIDSGQIRQGSGTVASACSWVARAALLVGLSWLPSLAAAVTITYQLTGILSGSLGPTSFTDARVDFTFVGDTSHVVDASTVNPALPPGYAALNTDPNAIVTVTVHLPGGGTQSAQFTQQMYWTADYYNIGVGIGSSAYGPTYPFAMHMGSSFTIGSDSPPLAGSPFSCTNFNPSGAPTCAAAASVTTTAGPLIISAIQTGCPNVYIGISPVPCQTETSYVASTGPNVFLTFSGEGAGTISGTSGAVSCSATCSATIAAGTPVTLTASPQPGSVFSGWTGPCLGTTPTCVISGNGLANVGATFSQALAATLVSINNLAACAETTLFSLECWGTVAGGFAIGGPGTYDGDAESPVPAMLPAFGNSALSVAVGENWNNCALLAGGAVQCWPTSHNSGPAPKPVAGLTSGVAAVSSGAAHSCALTTAGAVECWGDNTYGELGDGTTTSSTTPVSVVGLPPIIVAIAAGGGGDPIDRGLNWAHTCALASDGTVWCWGSNSSGQLGNGVGSGMSSTPVQVAGLSAPALAISAGATTSCALTTGGAAACWGGGFYGPSVRQFGFLSAVALPGVDSGVIGIAAGSDHDCAVSGNGTVRCWGDNNYGELGDGTTTSSPTTPVVVAGLPADIVAVAAGGGASLGGTIERNGNDSCALTSTGAIWCWGDNSAGQLGASITAVISPTPVQVMGFGSMAAGQPTPNRIQFTVPAGPPAPLASAIAGGSPLTLAATATSGHVPRFGTVTPDRCTITGATVNFFAPGVCIVQAVDPGNGTYAGAPTQTRVIVVKPGTTSQTSVALAASQNPGLVGSPLTITATVTGNGPTGSVTFYDAGVALIGCGSGATAPLVGTAAVCALGSPAFGLHAITAVYSGDAKNAGSTSPVLMESILKSQAITFPTIGSRQLSAGVFVVAPTASSGLLVTIASTTPAVCTISGFTVTPLIGGTCALVATQSGNTQYAPALAVSQSVTIVAALAQTITFAPIASQVLGGPAVPLSATASSGLPVAFASLAPAICTVGGASVALAAAGTCTISANQPGNSNYAAAPEVTQSFTVQALQKQPQSITFPRIPPQRLGKHRVHVVVTASSGLPVTLTTLTQEVCSVAGMTIALHKPGHCIIVANQGGNAQYLPAPEVRRSFHVERRHRDGEGRDRDDEHRDRDE